MMEGIPANKSTRVLTTDAIRVFRKYSATNKDVEKANGKAIIKASTDVNNVPAINNSAPYFSSPLVGFHSEENKNFHPNSWIEVIDPRTNESIIAPEISSISNDAMNKIFFRILSLFT